MTELSLSVNEPFTSPAWGSNFVVFASGEAVAEDSAKDYITRLCKYARTHEVYLVSDRFWLQEYLCLAMISPEGKPLGLQRALYFYTGVDGKRYDALDVINTEFGGVLLCVDVDIYRPEIARIGEGMGVQYLICSQYIDDEDYNSSMVITGAWNAAQSGNLYVVDACNQFSCVCAPLEVTKHGDGFVVSPSLHTPLTAKLRAETLREVRRPALLSRKFYAVHHGELLKAPKAGTMA